jgi:alpha-methylacyl-CoA racemase
MCLRIASEAQLLPHGPRCQSQAFHNAPCEQVDERRDDQHPQSRKRSGQVRAALWLQSRASFEGTWRTTLSRRIAFAEQMKTGGPLHGIKVLEFSAIGPVPHCAMLLSDLGATVLRIDRPGDRRGGRNEVVARGRASLVLDLKVASDRSRCLQIANKADVLIEGFRPGVMERLGIGPDDCLAANPRLIYGRMTGWGQTGPLAQTAGHDINYLAVAGALASMGSAAGPPIPPLNLVGDYGGGSLYLALGIASALFERERSGKGQVIDAAIVDGVASLMAFFRWYHAAGLTTVRRGHNFLDGSAHYYRCYRCADGKYVAVGALEDKFYAQLLEKLGIPMDAAPPQGEAGWQRGGETLARVFESRTRDEWCGLFEGTDGCVSPVLEMDEAALHPHLRARNVVEDAWGVQQPAAAPRFSRTPGWIKGPPPDTGQGGEELLREWGMTSG